MKVVPLKREENNPNCPEKIIEHLQEMSSSIRNIAVVMETDDNSVLTVISDDMTITEAAGMFAAAQNYILHLGFDG